VGFEPTISKSERAKTVHALDRATTVTGYHSRFTKREGASDTHSIDLGANPEVHQKNVFVRSFQTRVELKFNNLLFTVLAV
jgi:hypothetical protein